MTASHLFVIDEPNESEIQPILEGLHRFGVEAIGGKEPKKVAVLLRDSGNAILGGATGHEVLGNFYLTHLWVDNNERSKGNGSVILKALERKVFMEGCNEIRLETMNAQAVAFYLHRNYEPFARVEQYIPGFEKVFFRKTAETFNSSLDTDSQASRSAPR